MSFPHAAQPEPLPLFVPDIPSDADALTAALSYAEAGWYVLPVERGTKHPGSVVGSKWQAQSSRNPKQIAAWFAGTSHGIALHAGRSGAVVFDVDNPAEVPEILSQAFATAPPPMQTTRDDDSRRGHYFYAQPPDRVVGNGTGGLGNGWGEVRGRNGVIIVAPSVHEKAENGGRYTWQQSGPVPPLPATIAELLPDSSGTSADAATDREVRDFLEQHQGQTRRRLLHAVTATLDKVIAAGGKRHDATLAAACQAMREAGAGLYPAAEAAHAIREIFVAAINGERDAGPEYAGILAYAVAQAGAADPDQVRLAVEQRVPAGPFGDLVGLLPPPTHSDTASSPQASTVGVQVAHRGQTLMALRLAKSHSDRLLYPHGMGWHHWNGSRWIEDKNGHAKRAVLAELKTALGESLGDPDLRADVRRCESSAGINGVLDIASALPEFAVTPDDLDADAYLLNVANGTLNLRTGQLKPHAPRDRITNITRGAYRLGEPSGDDWAKFLERVLPDAEVRSFLQRFIGVGLLGLVREHLLAVLIGSGANGKGTFYQALSHALGGYVATAEPDLFMHRAGAHPTGEMDLKGRRIVVVSESEKERRLAEATMKRLTGGDTIRARRMHRDFVEFRPSHTPLLVTNHLPRVSGDDPAIWRRLRVIPFDVVIPPEERDVHLEERLQLAADDILAWAIVGYQHYAQGGLAEPAPVLRATEGWQHDSDAVSRFVDDECVTVRDAGCTTFLLHGRWLTWAAADGAEPMSLKAFGQALDRLGWVCCTNW